ncbi:CRISPR-associated protein Csx11 [Candidatus Harpocratesius sp.]
MSIFLQNLKNSRDVILIGEIGALLHDIGKCHPKFIKKNSIEGGQNFHHTEIDEFINPILLSLIKNQKFTKRICNETFDIYSMIRNHHSNSDNSFIIKLIQICDRKDSADDKGIVRRKQPIDFTVISSPFGFQKEIIKINSFENQFNFLNDNLICIFKEYLINDNLQKLREKLLDCLKKQFSHALGETRIPANDVTLWDHSYSTSSLLKTLLASFFLGNKEILEKNFEPKWRLFGILWNGKDFIGKGRKISDFLKRTEIINEIKKEIRKEFEIESPFGNVIYEDINCLYFTFPIFVQSSKTEKFAKEISEKALKIIKEKSKGEIWPVFSLSKESRSLTIIANELQFLTEILKIPKRTSVLFIEGKEKEYFDNYDFQNKDKVLAYFSKDICPICGLRLKSNQKERCTICEDRIKGRRKDWNFEGKKTIWIDEVADIYNQIALISIDFDLSKWLDGTLIKTIYSQTINDWFEKLKINQIVEFIKRNKIREKLILIQSIKRYLDEPKKLLNYFMKIVCNNRIKLDNKKVHEDKEDNFDKFLEIILQSFFEDSLNNLGYDTIIKRLESNLFPLKFNEGNLKCWLFTQNPSPARLYRIWCELEEFFSSLIQDIKKQIFYYKSKRLVLPIHINEIKKKINCNLQNTQLIIKVKELVPEKIVVYCNKDFKFVSIESMEKYKFKKKTGVEAVKEAVAINKIYFVATENKSDENLIKLNNKLKVDKSKIKTIEYFPLILINKSSNSLRFIVRASSSLAILNLLKEKYNTQFEKVIGKLSMNVKLLISKKKFPLYILLDTEQQMLKGTQFNKSKLMNPWWNLKTSENYDFYKYYPFIDLEKDEGYQLKHLKEISKGTIFSLFPGYFDFDFLAGTSDCYNIYYENGKRCNKSNHLLTKRPLYFYQISYLLEIVDLLFHNLSISQIHYLEQIFLEKFKTFNDNFTFESNIIFSEFVKTSLKTSFNEKWDKFREETRNKLINSVISGLFFDAISLYAHYMKNEGRMQNER